MTDTIKGITFDLFNTLVHPTSSFTGYKKLSEALVNESYEIYPQKLEATTQ